MAPSSGGTLVSLTGWLSLLCSVLLHYLTEEGDVEAKSLGIPRASIHVIADQQHQLQEFTEAFTFLHFFTGKCHIHDVWPDVVHLLLKRQLEENAVETWPQEFNRTHLNVSEKGNVVSTLNHI